MKDLGTWLLDTTEGYGLTALVIMICLALIRFIQIRHQQRTEQILMQMPIATLTIKMSSGRLLQANTKAQQLLGIRKIGSTFRYPELISTTSLCQQLASYSGVTFSGLEMTWPVSEVNSKKITLSGRYISFRGKKAWLLYAVPTEEKGSENSQQYDQLLVSKSALNSLSELVYFQNNQGELLGTNKAFDRFWRDRVEEGIVDINTSLMRGRSSNRSWTTSPDGSSCLLETHQSLLLNEQGETVGTLSISHDVTDWHVMQENLRHEIEKRQDTEVALAHRDSLLQSILDSCPDPIGMFNEHYIYEACNEPFAYSIGVSSAEQLIGKTIKDVLPEAVYRRYHNTDQKVLETGNTVKYIDELKHSDGTITWFDVIKSAYYNSANESRGVLVMARDVTERVLAEQALAKVNAKLKTLSFIDGLTKVANRRSFDEQLKTLWLLHIRQQQPLSIILCDIDSFKSYNDNYGHQLGDEALRKVADVFSSVVTRATDMVARYGGEEFVMLLPDTTLEGADIVARKIHQALVDAEISHEYSEISSLLTVSLGVASIIPKHGQDYGELVGIADKALYQAKRAGRNQTQSISSI
ncbi:diguanylate cyclase [Vibrio sp. Of7-15]|uniref:GGDEF domain-containing protein n=1 Tax=Vibrio sp. Of7-15 TaxID=2724879 RepID=UPI001EF274F2|nr:GGDEF domain-containing protein [Vibrio sp. Of7-15]MCG7497620.1 diguanylate cyclase [Vibrio sp. Of7-15]